ncbi:MGMT family protein [Proteobacteria bacterium 005FR1]|nr:MGMT family protein [Proteobacteria bacterium 005FR1]
MIITNRERIFQVVLGIPAGRVATYGQVADLAGLPRAARLVGGTLKALPEDSKLPWHRVVNAHGRISLPMEGHGQIQQQRLEDEGILFLNGKIDLANYRWRPC